MRFEMDKVSYPFVFQLDGRRNWLKEKGRAGEDGSSGWLVGWLVGWLAGWLVGWLIWLFDWLVVWMVGWLVGWLVGWMVDVFQHLNILNIYAFHLPYRRKAGHWCWPACSGDPLRH